MDLVKESSLVDDYTHRIAGVDTVDGAPVYVVESTPEPDAAVVWGRIVMRVRRVDYSAGGTRSEYGRAHTLLRGGVKYFF
jgi:hypothetical protein